MGTPLCVNAPKYSFNEAVSSFQVFIFAILAFELGSLICGVAPNSTALIVGRAISGLGEFLMFASESQF
jgi:MFS family permease